MSLTGYIDEYTISNGIIIPKSTTNLTNYKSDMILYAIKNTNNLKSPKNKTQTVILTTDEKYIVYPYLSNDLIKSTNSQIYFAINYAINKKQVFVGNLEEIFKPIIKLIMSPPSYADDIYKKEIDDINKSSNISDEQKISLQLTVLKNLLGRINNSNADIDKQKINDIDMMIDYFKKLNFDTGIPDNFCFDFEGIPNNDLLKKCSCKERPIAQSTINAPSSSMSTSLIVMIVLVSIILLVGGWFAYKKMNQKGDNLTVREPLLEGGMFNVGD
jgi:hypothetical protein